MGHLKLILPSNNCSETAMAKVVQINLPYSKTANEDLLLLVIKVNVM